MKITGQQRCNLVLTESPLGANVANPTAAPTLATATTGGSLAPATIYVTYTWQNANGETQVSPEASIVIPAGTSTNTVTVTVPALPTGATLTGVYASTASGTETKQGTTATTSFVLTTLIVGAAKPLVNALASSALYVKTVVIESLKSLFVTTSADQAGTLLIEESPLGLATVNDWVQVASRPITANTPDFYTTSAFMAYLRITYTNNTTAQAKFLLNVDGFAI